MSMDSNKGVEFGWTKSEGVGHILQALKLDISQARVIQCAMISRCASVERLYRRSGGVVPHFAYKICRWTTWTHLRPLLEHNVTAT